MNDLSWVPEWAKPYCIETDAIMIAGLEYRYFVARADLQPNLPFFVGCNVDKKYMFISSAVPAEFREAFFTHEHFCLAVYGVDDPDGCVKAFKRELLLVSQSRKTEYILCRQQLFRALVDENFLDGALKERAQLALHSMSLTTIRCHSLLSKEGSN